MNVDRTRSLPLIVTACFWLLCCASLFRASAALADHDIVVRGLMNDMAVVEIDGKQRVLKKGKSSPEGVTLISANSKSATLEIDGKRRSVSMTRGRHSGGSAATSSELRIPRGVNGHYYITGLINKHSANFMVDTGATAVSLSEMEAQRLGLSWKDGERIGISTASTNGLAYRINLNSITVGSITVHNVEALVLPGSFPEVILLGNSFLNQVNVNINEGVLVLETRY